MILLNPTLKVTHVSIDYNYHNTKQSNNSIKILFTYQYKMIISVYNDIDHKVILSILFKSILIMFIKISVNINYLWLL